MSRQFIFARTAKGELATRTADGVLPDERRVLLLIDGVSNVENLSRKFPPSLQRQLDNILSSLLKAGYIEEYAVQRRQLENGKLARQLHLVRTAKGEVSMRTPGRMASDEKRVMLLIDGLSSVDSVSKKLPPSLQEQLDGILLALFKAGYITEQSAKQAAGQSKETLQTRLEYRLTKTEFQEVVDSSQQITQNLLTLTESEIARRTELEAALADTQAKLLSSEIQLAETHLHYAQVQQQLTEHIETLQRHLAEKSVALEHTLGRTLHTHLNEDVTNVVHDIQALPVTNEPRTADTASLPIEHTNEPLPPHWATVRDLRQMHSLSDDDLRILLRQARWQEAAADTVLIAEGEKNTLFYMLMSGKLRLVKHHHTLDFLHIGDCFGEILPVAQDAHPATESVVTRTNCLLLTLPATSLNSIPATLRIHLTEALIRTQSRRIKSTVEKLASLLI